MGCRIVRDSVSGSRVEGIEVEMVVRGRLRGNRRGSTWVNPDKTRPRGCQFHEVSRQK